METGRAVIGKDKDRDKAKEKESKEVERKEREKEKEREREREKKERKEKKEKKKEAKRREAGGSSPLLRRLSAFIKYVFVCHTSSHLVSKENGRHSGAVT